MGLQDFWFIALAALFLGFLVLEGFDFGVGMLMAFFGRCAPASQHERHRRAVLNTIGPVWDGNEVWLITAGGAMFAAFPEMYATLFSGLYLPLLVILVAMIVRICAIEWRGKIDEQSIIDWCRENMAAYKHPRIVEFVDSLPKSGAGKIMWRELQDREAAAAKQPAALS